MFSVSEFNFLSCFQSKEFVFSLITVYSHFENVDCSCQTNSKERTGGTPQCTAALIAWDCCRTLEHSCMIETCWKAGTEPSRAARCYGWGGGSGEGCWLQAQQNHSVFFFVFLFFEHVKSIQHEFLSHFYTELHTAALAPQRWTPIYLTWSSKRDLETWM